MLTILVCLPRLTFAQQSINNEAKFPATISWSELEFTGLKLFTSTRVTIKIDPVDTSSEIKPQGEKAYLADCSATGQAPKILSVKSSSKGMWSRGYYEEKTWFNQTDGLPFQRMRLSNDDNPWVKTYCWEEKGVRRHKIEPAGSRQNRQPPSTWTQMTESFYAYPEEVSGCRLVSDPALILYILSELVPGTGQDPHEICVFGRKQLHRLTIQQEKSTPIAVSFGIRSASLQETCNDQITPIVYSIKTAALPNGNRDPETFSLLGLNRDIRIYMDPEKRLPVKISGTNNSIGKLDLELQNARLN